MLELGYNILKYLDEFLGLHQLSYRSVLIRTFILVFVLFVVAYYRASKRNISLQPSRYELKHLVASFTIVTASVILIELSYYMISRIVVGEATPDTLVILRHGHWSKSYKNPYYDLINVPAFYRALNTILYNLETAHSMMSIIPVDFISGLLFIIVVYLIARNLLKVHTLAIIIATVALIAMPLSNFTIYAAAPIALSLLGLFLTANRESSWREYLALALLYLGALFIHGISLLMILLPLTYIVIISTSSTNTVRQRKKYSRILLLMTLLAATRFFLTTALVGASTYIHELLQFLYSPTESVIREVKLSHHAVPRITAYAFTVLPSIALAPMLSNIINFLLRMKEKVCTYIHSKILLKEHYVAFALSSMLILVAGFIASTFSNSLSRELGVPATMLMVLPASYTIHKLLTDRKTKILLIIVVVMALLTSLFTPYRIPYYEEYRPLTTA